MGSSVSTISADGISANVERKDGRQNGLGNGVIIEEEFDVMISYSHDDKATMTRLRGEKLWCAIKYRKGTASQA